MLSQFTIIITLAMINKAAFIIEIKKSIKMVIMPDLILFLKYYLD